MRRIFNLFVFTIIAAALVPACGDEDPITPPPDGDTDTDTDTDSDTDTEADAGPLDCEEVECPSSGVLYVDADATGDETGLSWADAVTDLQLGLAIGACCAPVQLWVAEGTYIPGTAQDDTFQLIAGVALYGGFDGTETALEERDWTAHETILHGADGGTFHVVTGASGATLDGFTITGGGVCLSGDDYYDDYGEAPDKYHGAGMRNVDCDETLVVANCRFTENVLTAGVGAGMYNEASSPTVSNCAFVGNSLGIESDGEGYPHGPGGGMAVVDSSSPVITSCAFDGNHANEGGAIYLEGSASSALISNCTVAGNIAARGGGIYLMGGSAQLVESELSGNHAVGIGDLDNGPGGVIFANSATLVVDACVFESNIGRDGGAVYAQSTDLQLTDTVFHDNFANDGGGALALSVGCNASLSNCVFARNLSDYGNSGCGGAAISAVATQSSGLSIANSTFEGNVSSEASGGAVCALGATIANSIFFGDSPDELSGPDGFSHDVTYSLVSGGHAGDGNLDGDPLFVDAAAGDLHLQPGSPCIDAADTSVAPEFDLEGNARVGEADMGAYEFTSGK